MGRDGAARQGVECGQAKRFPSAMNDEQIEWGVGGSLGLKAMATGNG